MPADSDNQAKANQARAEQLDKAVSGCEIFCKEQISALTSKFYTECFFTILVPIAATVLTYFFSKSWAAVAPLAVGAANVVDKTTTSKTLFTTYFSDKSTLESRITAFSVRINLALQEPDPNVGKTDLDAVAKDINTYLASATSGTSGNATSPPAAVPAAG
jgi:hypothetical protein